MRSEVSWPSIPAMLREVARERAGGIAIVDGEQRLTWNDLVDRVDEAARALIAGDIEAGDRVAIWAPNSLEWIVAALAITSAGGVLVPINTRFKGGEAAFCRAIALVEE